MATCGTCGSELTGKWTKKFCSRKCATKNAARIAAEKTRKIYNCGYCGIVYAKTHKGQIYCSRECSTASIKAGRLARRRRCLNGCGKPISHASKRFCSMQCAADFRRADTICKWQAGEISGAMTNIEEMLSKTIRDYILAKFEYKCCECGWSEVNKTTKKVPVQVHHVDGNCCNHKEYNLTVLCPNCHSLTPTYGGLNAGSGRELRRTRRRLVSISENERFQKTG